MYEGSALALRRTGAKIYGAYMADESPDPFFELTHPDPEWIKKSMRRTETGYELVMPKFVWATPEDQQPGQPDHQDH